MVHYFSKDLTGIEDLKLIKERIRGFDLKFYTASNVFSKGKVDEGTKCLAENMIIIDGWKVLDLGCGYGVLGIVAAKINKSGLNILSDINPIAVKLAKMNCKINNVKCEVVLSDLFENLPYSSFDTIITNPPYSAGKKVVFKFIEGSHKNLKRKGLFQIVIPKNFEETYMKFLDKVFKEKLLLYENNRYICIAYIK